MKRWLPSKNAPAATADGMRLEASLLKQAIAVGEDEVAEINSALAGLTCEPSRLAEATARLEGLETDIRSKRRALTLIESAIPAAEKREEQNGILAERAELDRVSDKLAKNLPERLDKAANALAEILKEIADDRHAWDVMNMRLRNAGINEQNGWSAERRARHERNEKTSTHLSLTLHSCVLGWGEKTIFRGESVKLA